MVNIHDIAKKAGVSVTTVSRVLNNHKYVSEETRQIGVIIPYNNNQAFDQILHGILNKSIEHEYSVLVLPTIYDAKKELEYLSMLQTKMLNNEYL